MVDGHTSTPSGSKLNGIKKFFSNLKPTIDNENRISGDITSNELSYLEREVYKRQ